ncbi:IucA/IucC family C-terminal-domain containing protein [Mesobacillus zeae]|uniref:IucA/IucC family C-terminal-domain containing protein n=1 Tax=Mesobacillus zeae TaxID=1917180 RepID=UPI0015E7CC8C|nr:IucA/IucC family C-terminal-domain containing protein [Mesobacillus zeae]
MAVKLTLKEAEKLERFRFSSNADIQAPAVNIGHIIDKAKVHQFLKEVQQEVQAPDLRVAASVFTKRFAFVAVIYLYALTVWNKRLLLSLDAVILINNKSKGNWLPEYYVKNLEAVEFQGGDREEWRKEALEHLFQHIVFPVLDSLANAGQVSKLVLWENIAVYIFWLYENVLEQSSDPRIQSDFDYIVNLAPGSLFGKCSRNPLKNSKPVLSKDLNETVRIRKSCCFSYQLGEKQTYCKICPLSCRQLMKN